MVRFMPVLLFQLQRMDQTRATLNQLLEQIPTLFDHLATARNRLGDLSASARNEVETVVISSHAAVNKLRGLVLRIPTVPVVSDSPGDVTTEERTSKCDC